MRVYRGERLAPLLMLAPAVIILLVLVIGPFVFLIDTALHRHNLFQATPPRYVGLDNFYWLPRKIASFQRDQNPIQGC